MHGAIRSWSKKKQRRTYILLPLDLNFTLTLLLAHTYKALSVIQREKTLRERKGSIALIADRVDPYTMTAKKLGLVTDQNSPMCKLFE